MVSDLSRLLTVLVLMVCATSAAVAQPARTFVASTGSDGNACSIAAPCRTLQKGIDAVAAGGDVLIMDSGGFGSNVMITKSVSVFAPPGGQSRVVVPTGGMGITINGNNISVALSGLGVTGLDDGVGVKFLGGTSLSLSNLDINVKFNGSAVAVSHTAAGGHLLMSNTVLRNSLYGFIAYGTSGSIARATIINSRAEDCGRGFEANQYSIVAVQSSTASGKFGSCGPGFFANGVQAKMTVDQVVATDCAYGVLLDDQGSLTVSNALISGNTGGGWVMGNGSVGRTYGNNRISGNNSDTLNGFIPISEQ